MLGSATPLELTAGHFEADRHGKIPGHSQGGELGAVVDRNRGGKPSEDTARAKRRTGWSPAAPGERPPSSLSRGLGQRLTETT